MWATDRNRVQVEIRSLVRNSINGQKASESVNLDQYLNGDMAGGTAESRKTEASGKGRTIQGGEHQMDYNDKKTLTEYQADSPEEAEDGDRVVRVQLTNMSGRGDDGEPVDVDLVSVERNAQKERRFRSEPGVQRRLQATRGCRPGRSSADS
ncbi:MAG: hypothetical protein ABEI86_04775 [Halobacteriaceae archaeon]